MEKTGQKPITNSTFVSIPGLDPIRDGRPFKCKPHLDKLRTANQATAYNSCTPTIGRLHMSIVDDKIRPILLRQKFTFPFIRSESGKCGTSGKPN